MKAYSLDLRQKVLLAYRNNGLSEREGVENLITSVGARLMYLPPYSPDFSPIELAWSKIKSQIRRVGA